MSHLQPVISGLSIIRPTQSLITKTMALGDLADFSDTALRACILNEWEEEHFPDNWRILIGYHRYEDSSGSAFWLRQDDRGNFYEGHGSHCSCYGFEGQWKPEHTAAQYLKSDKISRAACCDEIKQFLANL